MKTRSLFDFLVVVAIVATIFVNSKLVLVSKAATAPLIDQLLTVRNTPPAFESSPISCRNLCRWEQDERTHQFLELNQDPSQDQLERVMLSSEGYGRLADLALGYHLSPSEADLLQNPYIMEQCLPRRVLIIFFETDMIRRASFNQIYFTLNLTIPHVVIGTGWGNIWNRKEQLQVINNPYLLRWYGSSQERSFQDPVESMFHPKAYPLPVGLVSPTNRFEQAKPIVQVNEELREHRRASRSSDDLGRTKLVLINFSNSPDKAAYRQAAWSIFCNATDRDYSPMNQTCESGGFYDRNTPGRRRRYFANEWNVMASNVYRDWAQHKFTVSPRGQQKDCHRFWEALYLGSIPIVLRRDGYYQDLVQHYFQLPEEELPILFVKRWRHVTADFLDKMWRERFVHLLRKPEWQWPQRLLTTDYVQDLIVRGIQDELQLRNDSSTNAKIRAMIPDPNQVFVGRRRCYSPRRNNTLPED